MHGQHIGQFEQFRFIDPANTHLLAPFGGQVLAPRHNVHAKSKADACHARSKIAKTKDFEGQRFQTYRVIARTIGIFKEPDGSFYAIEMLCKHQNADLSAGTLDGDVATCPRHGWKYNVRTGECLTNPSTPLRRFALKVEDGTISVSISPMES